MQTYICIHEKYKFGQHKCNARSIIAACVVSIKRYLPEKKKKKKIT